MGEAQAASLTIMVLIAVINQKVEIIFEQTEFEVSLGCIRPGIKLASEQATTNLKIRVLACPSGCHWAPLHSDHRTQPGMEADEFTVIRRRSCASEKASVHG